MRIKLDVLAPIKLSESLKNIFSSPRYGITRLTLSELELLKIIDFWGFFRKSAKGKVPNLSHFVP